MSCPHPPSAQHVDRSRGTVTCAICGEVVTDQQLELDPLFARGERAATGRPNLRALGQPRPLRTTQHVTPVSQRPSVELARRNIYNIARQLEISGDMAEQATGIYKLAVTNNAVVGARTSILCACLYAVCRREGTNHVIYDFADATKESPYEILRYMRFVCEVTHTSLPPIDVSMFVYRFAEQLDLGDKTRDVALCALKVIRSMRDDWIEYGRRPLGVVAAALVVACHTLDVPRSPEQLCGMVRLSAPTIHLRLMEFLRTPTAALQSIDDYECTTTSAPPAFSGSLPTSGDDAMRGLASSYYELVSEAKQSAAATPERCERWRQFIIRHCEVNNVPYDEATCDLTKFSPKEQLTILGLPHAVPLSSSGDIEPLTLPKLEDGVEASQAAMRTLLDDKNFDDFLDQDVLRPPPANNPPERRVDFADKVVLGDWELYQLPPLHKDTDVDLEEFVVRDNELRIRREQAAKALYRSEWDCGAACTTEDVEALIFSKRSSRKRARDPIVEHATMEAALQRALRGKGASTINVSQLDQLVPGLLDDTANSDNASVDDDWY